MISIKRLRTVLLCTGLLVILAVIGTSFLGDERKKVVPVKPSAKAVSEEANIKLDEVRYSTVNEKNIKVWDLTADTAMYFKDRELLMLEKVSVSIYSGDKVYRVNGDSGQFNTRTRDIDLKGNVKGVLPDGTVIRTDKMNYDHDKRLMTTREKVMINRGNISIAGVGVVINITDKKLLILDNVRASQNADNK